MLSGAIAANLINKYFSGIGEQLATELKHSDMVFEPTQHDCSFEWVS